MVEWSVQLFELDISFEKRGHIKAQALTDFITELTPMEHPSSEGREWFLYIDGASNQAGSEASIILEGSEGASNNQAEYEALLVRIRLAKELDAQVLTAKSDSKLVTGQVNGKYQVRAPQLAK
ncbi:hypothetical protein CR513_31311, partial [Mucuna pruriens]